MQASGIQLNYARSAAGIVPATSRLHKNTSIGSTLFSAKTSARDWSILNSLNGSRQFNKLKALKEIAVVERYWRKWVSFSHARADIY